MYLSRLYISGFRSIDKLDLRFQPGLNIIVGRNNAGKSNMIRALDLVLGEHSPTWTKGDLITEKDFRSRRITDEKGRTVDVSGTEFFIWCELERGADEELDYDALYSCTGFYVHARIKEWTMARKPIKDPIRISRDDIPTNYQAAFEISEDESQEKDYINPKLRNQKTFEHQFHDKRIFAFAFRATRHGDAIHRDLRLFYRETDEEDWIMAFRASVRNELLQSAIIPSFRDPDRQLRPTFWTWYGKLLRALTEGRIEEEELKAAFAEVRRLADACFATARDAVNNSSLNVAFPDTELYFQFSTDNRLDLYKSCAIYVDDGQRSLLSEKGSGIQSAVIIGLFSFFTHHVNTISSALLCIEEPELYLHPHAQRVISARLEDFLAGGRNQVILTTHSPEFISARTGAESITIVRRKDNTSIATTAALRDYRELVLDLNQAELFFADRVIICEGFDGYILRAVADCLYPGLLDAKNVSIVSAGGKDNIDRLVTLVGQLGIDAYVIADFDYLLRDQDHEAARAAGGKPHKNILSLGETYFSNPRLLGEQGVTEYRELQRLAADLRRTNQRAFYTAARTSEIGSPALSALPARLRAKGIGVLDGQVEDLVKDSSILDDGKFRTDSVFRLNQKHRSGTPLGDLIDLGPFREFLKHILEPTPPTPQAAKGDADRSPTERT